MIVLSSYQTEKILKAKRSHVSEVEVSLDLNLTISKVTLLEEGIRLPNDAILLWADIEAIDKNKAACYRVLENGSIEKIYQFSASLQRAYSLMPTDRAPTMLLAGFPMHRIKGIDPQEDTRRKIQTISPVSGPVLDTTTGLGYTAIQAARYAAKVVTIELDPTVLEICRRNPWSQELFTNPRIEQKIGNSFEVIQTLDNQSFTRIFHDPPTFQLAGELYSEAFYKQLVRVLRRGGRLYHYIGDLASASGSSVAKGVVRRLQDAGFQRVQRVPEAFGVTATL